MQSLRQAFPLLIALLLLPVPVWAKNLVLVHGFGGSGMDWRMHGVTPPLQQNGWVDGGNLSPLNPAPLPPMHSANVLYTVELPSYLPILQQVQWLDVYLRSIYASRQEPLLLAGHSAGGVVARAWLVLARSVPVDTLVTLASPNLGTPTADMVTRFSDTPLPALMGGMLGMDTWNNPLEQLLRELRVEQPGRFLYWLNHQPHPPIRYVALVRDKSMRPDRYDFVVPRYSQDLNKVYALRGRAEYWEVDNGHFLGAADGYALAMILSRP